MSAVMEEEIKCWAAWRKSALDITHPGQDHGADQNLQVTLSVAGRTYRLHCKQAPSLHVTQITV